MRKSGQGVSQWALPIKEESPMRISIASQAGMGQRGRGLAAGLEPVRMPQTWWRTGDRRLRRGEWGSTGATSRDASRHWEAAGAHNRAGQRPGVH
jgi:hypothetical protein